MNNQTNTDSTNNVLQDQAYDPKMVKAQKIAGFLMHLFWFVIVNIFLYILDYSDNGAINWAYWATFGWGIGIITHGLGILSKDYLVSAIYKNLK
jgi:hypothetical protein